MLYVETVPDCASESNTIPARLCCILFLGDVEDDDSSAGEEENNKVLTFMKGERSHLIVWQMFTQS